MKNHGKEDQDFLVKMGEGNRYWGVVYREEEQGFPFCGNNAIYSASLSYTLFFF